MLAVALQGRLGFKTIFDSRSLFVDECVAVGQLAPGGGAHTLWRALEKRMLNDAAVSVGVSAPMLRIMRDVSATARLALVPCCVDVDKFRWDPAVRGQIRQAEGWEHTTVVVFEGNVGRFSDLPTCIEYFKRIARQSGDAVFLVITPSVARQVREECRRGGLPDERVRVVSAPHGEVWKWLSAADVALHTLGRDIDRGTRLGIKFVEYLSCGLPVVCTPSVGGAAQVIHEYGVGAVLDLADPACDAALHELLEQRAVMRPRCRATAEKLFSVRACADAYVAIYRSLAQRDGRAGRGDE
jgi:glycosyltransferase involved in cell wall biosynthesis